jgi:hypothetical protein
MRNPAVLPAIVMLAISPAGGGGNCAGTATGLVPLTDLAPATYLGAEAGLYPGPTNLRPAVHDAAADRAARVLLRDGSGIPDAASGTIVLLSIGMSNTSQEFSRFVATAAGEPSRNGRVILVNGAQGGWDARRLSDPLQNPSYYAVVADRLQAAGVTTAQVGAAWLKEADAGPTEAFPDDALQLRGEVHAIVRDLKAQFPNLAQVWMSSRIYAGYASTSLNPEPFAYQSGFAVRWLIEDQLLGAPSLNFDPTAGPVGAPWLAWGPYLWADGLTPRSDGLVWTCDDLADDGTHPSTAGAQKVADLLLGFFLSDPIGSRWFRDCDPADAAVFSAPPEVLGLRVERPGAADLLQWQDLGPVAGSGTAYDVLAGALGDLRATGDLSLAALVATGVAGTTVASPVADPAPGDGIYYLVRGVNGCGVGNLGPGRAPP